MTMNNKVLLDGHVGADAELRYIPDGTPVVSFRLATNETYIDKAGERKTSTEWHWCQAFGSLAKTLGEYGTKGKHLRIEGRLRTREYTDKAGVKHYPTNVVVEEFKFGPLASGDKKPAEEVTGKASTDQSAAEALDEDIPF